MSRTKSRKTTKNEVVLRHVVHRITSFYIGDVAVLDDKMMGNGLKQSAFSQIGAMKDRIAVALGKERDPDDESLIVNCKGMKVILGLLTSRGTVRN